MHPKPNRCRRGYSRRLDYLTLRQEIDSLTSMLSIISFADSYVHSKSQSLVTILGHLSLTGAIPLTVWAIASQERNGPSVGQETFTTPSRAKAAYRFSHRSLSHHISYSQPPVNPANFIPSSQYLAHPPKAAPLSSASQTLPVPLMSPPALRRKSDTQCSATKEEDTYSLEAEFSLPSALRLLTIYTSKGFPGMNLPSLSLTSTASHTSLAVSLVH